MSTVTCTLLALAGPAACEREVTVEVPTAEARLVVEARLEHVQGAAAPAPQRVRLTTSDAYFADRAPPPARGAVVRVTDDAGGSYAFAELAAEPGVYEAAGLTPEVGRTYTLAVTWQGEQYAASDRLLPVAPIDSLYFAPRTGIAGPRDGLRAAIDFQDPPGVANYYLWDEYVDGRRVVASDSTYRYRATSADDLSDGRRVVGFQPYDGVALAPGADVLVRQVSLGEAAYRFYSALSEQTANDGSPFGVPAASVRGNVANVTRPAHRALGYFIAAEVAEARARVPAR